MTAHPYKNLPERAHWYRGVARLHYSEVDPVTPPPFQIGLEDKVATAGSCFAQHIARYLRNSGFCYFVSEKAHPIISAYNAEQFNYGLYSARYGNIYTSRQLVQLFDRAYGHFSPIDDYWLEADGTYLDPFRPSCNPGGFACLEELKADREQHFAAVRAMFEELDIFVFTLGLTECWQASEDGAVYPVCPGTAGGEFDEDRHVFSNLSVSEIVTDLQAFLERLKSVNPMSRVILTVSPVPLVATAENRSVLSSTVLSKSVLRTAADEIVRSHDNVFYFESYEIITGAFNRGRYFADDLRGVTEEGVNHVMQLFLKHYAGVDDAAPDKPSQSPDEDPFLQRMSEAIAVLCDEEALGQQ